jgi:hypothetical protein
MDDKMGGEGRRHKEMINLHTFQDGEKPEESPNFEELEIQEEAN